jgi:lipopolysaccharide transport system ATP-binding protein
MTAIEFDKVGKLYKLGLVGTGTLSNDLNRWWKMNILRQEDPYLKIGETNDRSTKGTSDYVWALKDISFKVEQGDIVGIIGKNGAGKSTLLKLLSQVTSPTTGQIRARGRIGSLLEVGTGFHPELTGRENIYMNGSIMGMTKHEIDRKIDEIVDFSGCERYIDTPTKRYSSGMTVRLGFAVAAFMEPEILVVDEVLAVGDAEFQKKAIGKMKDVSKGGGRTVLFVSHNMMAVKTLCQKGILLENGGLKELGPVDDIVAHYLKGDNSIFNHKQWDVPKIKKEGFELVEIGIRKYEGCWEQNMRVDDVLELIVRYRITHPFKSLHLTFHMKNEQGQKMFSFCGAGQIARNHDVGIYNQTCRIPANFFNWGSYSLDMFVVKDFKMPILIDYDTISFSLGIKQGIIGGVVGKEPGDITPSSWFMFSEEKDGQ